MSMRAGSIVITAALCLGLQPAVSQQPKASPLVEECAPPGGVWGAFDKYRGKIQKFADRTAVFLVQNADTPDKDLWRRSPPLSWVGGQFTSGTGIVITITPEGDGYRVYARTYGAHFSCRPAAGAPTSK